MNFNKYMVAPGDRTFVSSLFLSPGQAQCLVNICWINACICAQSCTTLWDPVGCSPPDSSVHGLSQTRILEWIVISFSRCEKYAHQLQTKEWNQRPKAQQKLDFQWWSCKIGCLVGKHTPDSYSKHFYSLSHRSLPSSSLASYCGVTIFPDFIV